MDKITSDWDEWLDTGDLADITSTDLGLQGGGAGYGFFFYWLTEGRPVSKLICLRLSRLKSRNMDINFSLRIGPTLGSFLRQPKCSMVLCVTRRRCMKRQPGFASSPLCIRMAAMLPQHLASQLLNPPAVVAVYRR